MTIREEANAVLMPKMAEWAEVDLSAGVDDAQASALNSRVGEVLDLLETKGVFKEDVTAEQRNAAINAVVEGFDAKALAADVLKGAETLRGARLLDTREGLEPRVEKQISDAGRIAGGAMDTIRKAMEYDHTKGVYQGTIFDALKTPSNEKSFRQLIMSPTSDPDIRLLQKSFDDMQIAAKMLHRPMNTLDTWDKFSERMVECAKALNTTDASSWAITQTTPDLIEQIYQSSEVFNLIRRIEMPQGVGTMSLPAEGTTLVKGYIAGEPTTDDDVAKFTASTPSTGTAVTFTSKSIAARVRMSWEMQEQSVIPLVPWARDQLVREMGWSLDDVIINGDTNNQDSLADTSDHRLAWIGFRAKALDNTGANVTMSTASTQWNYEGIQACPLLMGKYINVRDTVIFCSHAMRLKLGWLRDTGNYPKGWDIDRFGIKDEAGEMGPGPGTLNGLRVVPSTKVSQTLNSSAISASGSTGTALHFVYLPAWLMAVRSDLRLFTKEDVDEGTDTIVGRWAGVMGHLYGSALTTGMVYGTYVTDATP